MLTDTSLYHNSVGHCLLSKYVWYIWRFGS